MKTTRISTTKAPAAIGPYSQAYVAGDLLFTSGQGGISPDDGHICGQSITEQAERAMKNLKAIFEEAGTDFSHVVKTTCFLADMDDFNEFNAVYEAYFTFLPARSCIAVKELPLGILCEVEAVVCLK